MACRTSSLDLAYSIGFGYAHGGGSLRYLFHGLSASSARLYRRASTRWVGLPRRCSTSGTS
eukprot:9119432-Alexandrium_andersonii.AAC.1